MKKSLSIVVLLLAIAICAPVVTAQVTVRGPDPSTLRDPELEKDSMHNLEVARNYFKLKKAYVAALKRTEEIIAGNPNFTRIDEALFIAGSSSLSLAENKGKQTPSLYISYDGNTKKTLTAEEFREMGRDYLSRLVNDYPDSSFRGQAEEALKLVGGPKKQ
ncbi:MAG TPA: outer membrane protein assembly factor BamD [Pyrinomonadaceae bacterium]|nr:outer membrane protein assembly factor BamD [Pyrinomonadaceae bacterium]